MTVLVAGDLDGLGRDARRRNVLEGVHGPRRDVAQRLRRWMFRVAHDDRNAGVAAGAHCFLDRDLTEQRDTELGRELLAATTAEDVVAMAAIGTDEARHVVDDAEHRRVDLAEHRDAAFHVGERQRPAAS